MNIRFISPISCIVCTDVGKRSEREAEILLRQEKQLCEKIGELLQSRLSLSNVQVHYFVGDIYLNLVVNFTERLFESEQEAFLVQLEQMSSLMRETQSVTLSAGAGSLYKGHPNILKSYTEATQALKMKSMLESHLQEGKNLIRSEELRSSSAPHVAVLWQVLSFMDSNYHQEDLPLNRIVEEAHLTPSYISALFKRYQGANLSDYLMELHVKKAMSLLAETDLKTYEIPERVGYSNSQYFSVVFKRIAGFTPGEYRKTSCA